MERSASQTDVRDERIFARLADARIIPIVRSDSPSALEDDVARLAASGLRVIEATTSTPGWESVLADLLQAHREVCFGVGTVTTRAQAEAAAGCGADFVVTPFHVPGLRSWADASGMPLLEAGFTPGELIAAGAPGRPVKLFPASLGGPAYLRAIRTVLPQARLVPTGGIALADVRHYLDAGALAVGVGAALAHAGDPGEAATQALGGTA